MACSNCYNGCIEITSDQCVRYTGIDVPVLGIKNGDSLSYVEQALITFTTSLIDGTGIQPPIAPGIICNTVSKYLPTCETLTALDLFKALIEAVCDLQTQITTINSTLSTLNATYTIGCLSGVTGSSGTHDILQAAINKLCGTDTALTALSLDVSTNYVKLADLNSLIAAYLATLATSTQYYTKMVPYTMVPYFGSLSNFDATGAGLGEWTKIYLCNGLNGTPDMRGRVPVGAISGVPGPTPGSAVNPGSSIFNPNYAVGDAIYGANSIILDITQIPSHTHTPTVTDTHKHNILGEGGAIDGSGTISSTDVLGRYGDYGSGNAFNYHSEISLSPTPLYGITSLTSSGGITVSNANVGGGAAHSNIQPTLASYFIMYLP